MPNHLLESQLVKVWQHQLLSRTRLVTEEGDPIKIIYPGRINDDQGADFRDAVIATSQGLIKGDIEVHINSSNWRDHQHHRDVAYNRVILHVVMWHNTETATILQNGREVPVLALHRYINTPIDRRPSSEHSLTTLNRPCFRVTQNQAANTITDFLDRAGEERFFTKVAKFQADFAQTEGGQSLYQGVMSALGYSKNKLPFMELARRLPIKMLESMTHGEISDEECLARQQALLLGVAGLLTCQCLGRQLEYILSYKWIDRLEKLWNSYHFSEVMSPNAWHWFKVRPYNSPVRRLLAMSYLILRYRERGLFEELVNIVKEAPLSLGYRKLEKGLMVTTNSYQSGYPKSSSASRIGRLTLLGSERAAIITLNVLLPFTFAWSRLTYQPELERKSFDLYRHYPRLTENSVDRHMTKQLGLHRSYITSAQRQQGLIHIYNNMCTQGRCSDCPLS